MGSPFVGVYTNEYCGREMQDLGGGERTTGFELVDGVKTSAAPEICQEYSGTLRRNSMRECRDGGLNMNFMESYFCQVRLLAHAFLCIHLMRRSHQFPRAWPVVSSSCSTVLVCWLMCLKLCPEHFTLPVKHCQRLYFVYNLKSKFYDSGATLTAPSSPQHQPACLAHRRPLASGL